MIKLAAADLQPPVMTSLLLAAAGAALEVLAAAVEAAVVATTAVATTEAVAEYTPQTGQRRRRGRSSNTAKDGESSTVRLERKTWHGAGCGLTTANSPPEGWLRGQAPSGV